MVTLFNLLGVFFWLAALGSCVTSRSVLHETAGLLYVAVGALFLVGAALIDELRAVVRAIRPPPPAAKGPGDLAPKPRRRWFS